MDDEVLEGINRRNKLVQKFKRSELYDDNGNYKKAQNDVQNLIKNKKKNFFSNQLTENAGKPKELWKTLRKLGAPSKEQSMSTISLEKDLNLQHNQFPLQPTTYLGYPKVTSGNKHRQSCRY